MPTLVIHGTADPMFPIDHGVALAADLRTRRCCGSAEQDTASIELAIRETIVRAILEHTAAAEQEWRDHSRSQPK